MNLRKGMWVKHADGIGILNRFDTVAGELHLVNAAGETIAVRVVGLDTLTQAKRADIPEARRPSAARAAALGYV